MLDTDTKRRIDTARDILVGKVPDPKSQVEQITIALIYKFMDDMDAEAAELGGDRQFFTGDFAEYGWARLMSPSVSGHDLIDLYGKGISTMPQNPGIPVLFRDIFKNAYLPYRDPETLKSFLKIINEFSYDHSERLGDAFEYLLSVLGSQGDAGQFRTPRHIIDFMVEIMRPQKGEVILDPACGTAGFLISAYKYILRNNQDVNNISTLTPDEKGKLVKSFKGYDISPDMVRLSLVNLYLHGFANPSIAEYDTLTSEDRWNEFADLILANPPFMSPKGGIKPHKRFSIKAKRSEVLFVDYIAEHLTPTGRAGIIVPEGIIFQSQTAYKELRKALLKDSLVAVISLPAGVFNPYSGVKTSILILDKVLAKKSNTIAFFKVENDGFGLGAQRREIEQNDLPSVLESFRNYELGIKNGDDVLSEEFGVSNPSVLVVLKDKIKANGDFNFSGERYREAEALQGKFPQVELGSLCKPEYGFTASAADIGNARFIRITDINSNGFLKNTDQKFIDISPESQQYLLKKGDLLVARTGATFGKTVLFCEDYPAIFASYLIRLRFPPEKLLPEFYWAFSQSEKYWEQAKTLVSGGGQPQFNGNVLTQIKIPLPPIAIQQEIVAEIEGYQKVIDGARAVIDNYRPQIVIDPNWEVQEIGSLVKINNGLVLTELPDFGNIACIKVSDMNLVQNQREIVTSSHWLQSTDRELLAPNSVIFPKRGAAIATNKKRITRIPCLIDNNCMGLTVISKDSLIPEYLFYFLIGFDLSSISNSAGIALINNGDISSVKIPLPPLEIQKAIVAEIEAEQNLVNANRELITRFEKKIQTTLNRIWGAE